MLNWLPRCKSMILSRTSSAVASDKASLASLREIIKRWYIRMTRRIKGECRDKVRWINAIKNKFV